MKKKVLIIDDEFDLCVLLKAYLMSKNYEVVIANTLESGMGKLSAYHPDILFLDNNLPDGLGWEKAPEISKNNPLLKINLISGEVSQPASVNNVKGKIRILEKPLSLYTIDKAVA